MRNKKICEDEHLFHLLAHQLDQYDVIYPDDKEIEYTAQVVSAKVARQLSPLARWKRLMLRRLIMLFSISAAGALLYWLLFGGGNGF